MVMAEIKKKMISRSLRNYILAIPVLGYSARVFFARKDMRVFNRLCPDMQVCSLDFEARRRGRDKRF